MAAAFPYDSAVVAMMALMSNFDLMHLKTTSCHLQGIALMWKNRNNDSEVEVVMKLAVVVAEFD